MKALRLPTPHPGRFWFATGFRAVLRGSCSPKRSRADGGAARAWAVWSAGGPVPAGVRVDGVGSHRFPGDPSRAFALLQDPGRISGPSPKRSHRCCPRAQHGEGFSGHMISRLPQGFSTRCLRFARDVAAARARLTSGWPVGLCREGVEPSGSRRKVSERSHVVLLSRAYPVASWDHTRARTVWPGRSRWVLSGLAPPPLAEEGSVGYRAASHRGADEDAVLGMWIASRHGATRAHCPGLSPVPLPCM